MFYRFPGSQKYILACCWFKQDFIILGIYVEYTMDYIIQSLITNEIKVFV